MTCGADRRGTGPFAPVIRRRSLSVVTDNPPCDLNRRGPGHHPLFKPFLFTKEQVATILAEAARPPETAKRRYRGRPRDDACVVEHSGRRHGAGAPAPDSPLIFASKSCSSPRPSFFRAARPVGPKLGQSRQPTWMSAA